MGGQLCLRPMTRCTHNCAQPLSGTGVRSSVLGLVGAFAWLLAHVSAAHSAEASALQLQDDDQHSLELTRPAQRIVSLAPGATAMLFAAGAGDRVVGTSEYSDEPAAAADIPRIGDAQSFDLERILALHPDVVVVWRAARRRRSSRDCRAWVCASIAIV
jgi:iron complex transport system substrate-binding protein